MTAFAELRVLFRAPAGPRRGYGHLVRCRSLARALGVRPLVCLRGPAHAVDTALALGCDVVRGTPRTLIRALRLDLLVIDDPIASNAAAWTAAARAAGVAVVSVHDLGLGCHDADLRIDGSIVRRQPSGSPIAGRRLSGPAFAILDPRVRDYRGRTTRAARVVISLGGGPRVELAGAIAKEIAKRFRGIEVRVVGGFAGAAARGARSRHPNVVWRGAVTNLAEELHHARVAVVGGGVSLYEACAVGTAAVGVPVVPAQAPTVRGFVRHGAALGPVTVPRNRVAPARIADAVARLLNHEPLRRHVAGNGRRLVDGRGAERAARFIRLLVKGR
jgi:spore coat polysaccharide biosynthesis predicted glycosyltransferase SpsG